MFLRTENSGLAYRKRQQQTPQSLTATIIENPGEKEKIKFCEKGEMGWRKMGWQFLQWLQLRNNGLEANHPHICCRYL